jgi:hypothetical protein
MADEPRQIFPVTFFGGDKGNPSTKGDFAPHPIRAEDVEVPKEESAPEPADSNVNSTENPTPPPVPPTPPAPPAPPAPPETKDTQKKETPASAALAPATK